MAFKCQLRFAQNAANAIDEMPILLDQDVNYNLGWIGSKLSQHVAQHQRLYNKTVRAYGHKNKEGMDAVPVEKFGEFQEQMEELLDVEIEIDRGPFTRGQLRAAKDGAIPAWIYRAFLDANLLTDVPEKKE